MPIIRGFFSKYLVLETINYTNSSNFIIGVVYINVLFTYYYTYKLFYFRFQRVKLNPYQMFHSPYLIHSLLILTLAITTLFFRRFFIGYAYLSISFLMVPTVLKFIPLSLNVLLFCYLIVYLSLPTFR